MCPCVGVDQVSFARCPCSRCIAAEKATQDAAPTQDDFARIIQIIKDRDDRLHAYEADMRRMREDVVRMTEENKKLRGGIFSMYLNYF